MSSEVWRPLASFPGVQGARAAERPVRIVGRLANGVTVAQAQGELAAIVSTLVTVSNADRARRTIIMSLNETYVGKATQPAPMMMMAAVLVVLLIACSHAASLLLARSATRAREMSMRAALGAGRGRLVRQLLVESVLMALMAGVLGIAIAAGFVRAFANEVAGFGLPYWTRFTFDVPLVAIITGLCLVIGVAFGLLPALHQSRADLNDVLNQGGRSGIGSPRTQRMTATLLIGEVALTMILLSAASALVRSANGVYEADQRDRRRQPVGIPGRVAAAALCRRRPTARVLCGAGRTAPHRTGRAGRGARHQRAVQRPRQPRHRHGRRVPRRSQPGA